MDWTVEDSSAYEITNLGVAARNHLVSQDGTTLFAYSLSNLLITQFTLTIPFKASSAVATGKTFDVSSSGGFSVPIYEMRCSKDGHKLYGAITTIAGTIYEIDLPTAFDLTGATKGNEIAIPHIVNGSGSTIGAFFFNSDGTKLVVKNSGNVSLGVYKLLTPWDIMSIEFLEDAVMSSSWGIVGGGFINGDTRVFYVESVGDWLWSLDLLSPGVFTGSTRTLVPFAYNGGAGTDSVDIHIPYDNVTDMVYITDNLAQVQQVRLGPAIPATVNGNMAIDMDEPATLLQMHNMPFIDGIFLDGVASAWLNDGYTFDRALTPAVQPTEPFSFESAPTNVWTGFGLALTLLTPSNGGLALAQPVTFTWEAMTNATLYRLQIATDINFTQIAYDIETALLSHEVESLASETHYYWRVQFSTWA